MEEAEGQLTDCEPMPWTEFDSCSRKFEAVRSILDSDVPVVEVEVVDKKRHQYDENLKEELGRNGSNCCKLARGEVEEVVDEEVIVHGIQQALE